MWCAVWPDFVNLQESAAEFDGDPLKARAKLMATVSERVGKTCVFELGAAAWKDTHDENEYQTAQLTRSGRKDWRTGNRASPHWERVPSDTHI